MNGKEVCQTLPDELVERIIAMMPFPSIFKARCLSKSWLARFSSVQQQDDEAKKNVAILFQQKVAERSNNWETFCPVFISMEGDLIAYEKETHNWRQLPSVSFLPNNILTRLNVQIQGALLYASDTPSANHSGEIYVANILTRAWKHLPRPPTTDCPVHSSKLVMTDRSSKTYKVILFCKRNLYLYDFYFIQMYDSKSGSWSSKKLVDGSPEFYGVDLNAAYFNGVLYMVSGFRRRTDSLLVYLLAFNVEGTFDELSLLSSGDEDVLDCHHSNYFHLVVCETDLLMVCGMERHRDRFQRVLMIDLGYKRFKWLYTRVSDDLNTELRSTMVPVADDCHIYFGFVGKRGSQMQAYNVNEYFWSCLFTPPTSSSDCKYNWIASFQPGFRPFAAV